MGCNRTAINSKPNRSQAKWRCELPAATKLSLLLMSLGATAAKNRCRMNSHKAEGQTQLSRLKSHDTRDTAGLKMMAVLHQRREICFSPVGTEHLAAAVRGAGIRVPTPLHRAQLAASLLQVFGALPEPGTNRLICPAVLETSVSLLGQSVLLTLFCSV